jgi:hypothetical protein
LSKLLRTVQVVEAFCTLALKVRESNPSTPPLPGAAENSKYRFEAKPVVLNFLAAIATGPPFANAALLAPLPKASAPEPAATFAAKTGAPGVIP